MSELIDQVWKRFFGDRIKSLWDVRFPGRLRAVVVETADPLNAYRIRFRCPAMHDHDLPADKCPYALPSNSLGGSRAGTWTHPCIGDQVWIEFENDHPYGPIWSGFADPTRRRGYPLASVYVETPQAVDENGEKAKDKTKDYEIERLPKDRRPMSTGSQDRYGNLDIMSTIGFFPKSHSKEPASPGWDAVTNSEFEKQSTSPEVNDPDQKYIAKISKYGSMHIISDRGYYWKKDGDTGEFEGDQEKDDDFEIDRWQELQKLILETESEATDDGRRLAWWTRYGHLIEMRDTGWAQQSPKDSKSREGEYGPARYLSKSDHDMRWIKIRTKGGHLFQLIDIGFDPQEDERIKKKNSEEVAELAEEELKWWAGKDARQMRFISRHGFKFVISDEGSDTKDATGRETPRGKGILIKGRRTGADSEGDERGFHWEFNEQDDARRAFWASPRGMSVELNDKKGYMMLCSSIKDIVPPWKRHKENEFIKSDTGDKDAEHTTHHLKIDDKNEYIRFKTRSGHGEKPEGARYPQGSKFDEFQGLEIRDSDNGDGPWAELVDAENRGIWFSKREGISVFRGKGKASEMAIWIDDKGGNVVVRNKTSGGKIQMNAEGDVEIIASSIKIYGKDSIALLSNQQVTIQGGSAGLQIGPDSIQTNAVDFLGHSMYAKFNGCFPGAGAGASAAAAISGGGAPKPETKDKLYPSDRGQS